MGEISRGSESSNSNSKTIIQKLEKIDSKIKWGIIGAGKIANKFASDLLISENTSLVAIASRSIDKSKAFARKFGIPKSYGSYLELIRDSNIDIVYIALPHVFHFEYSKFSLQNGKSVLCEKPLGMNENEIKSLIQLAKDKNLFLMEGLWTRFIPGFEKVLSLIKKNVIGDIHLIEADFGFIAKKNDHGRLYNKDLGGGSLLDIGIYPVYLSLMVLGFPKNIHSKCKMTQNGVDSNCSMNFDYGNNVMANLKSTFEENTPTEAIIYGSKGYIKLHSRFHQTENISLAINGTSEIKFEIKYKGEGYFHEIEEVNRCLKESKIESSKHSLKTSLQVSQILDKVRKQIGLNYASDK